MRPAMGRWRDGALMYVALSGRPGQVGAWVGQGSLDGEVGSDQRILLLHSIMYGCAYIVSLVWFMNWTVW